MDVVMVATQEISVEDASLLQLNQGRNKSLWTNLPAVEVTVTGMGYDLVLVDTRLYY